MRESDDFDRGALIERIEERTRLWRFLAVVLLLALWAAAVYFVAVLPDIIPTKFSLGDEVVSTGSRWTILMLPGFSTLMWFVFLLIKKFPKMMNTPVRITEENREIQIKLAIKLLAFLSVVLELLFGILLLQMVNAAVEGTYSSANIWLPFVPMGILLIAVIHYVVQSVKYK